MAGRNGRKKPEDHMTRSDTVEDQMDFATTLAHKLLVLTMNLLAIAAVCAGMYRASFAPDEFTPVFFKTFFAVLAPSLVLGWCGKRWLRARGQA